MKAEAIEQIKALSSLNNSVDAFIEMLIKPPSENIEPPLQTLLKYESLKKLNSNSDNTYFLSVKIVAGGTNKTTKTILTNRLRHSGGAIVKYTIYNYKDGKIELSNVYDEYTGFTKIRNSK